DRQHRLLPSFPTRRSSDLAAARLVEALHKVGVVEQVAVSRGLGRLLDLTAAERRDARQPMTDIEGVGDLAELAVADAVDAGCDRSEEHTSELQSPYDLVCR